MTSDPNHPTASQFHAIDWQAIAEANHSRVISLTRDTVVMPTTHFGELRLTEVRSGLLQLHTSDLPDVTLIPGFLSDGYTSTQLITYLEDGQLIPIDVLSDRVLCALRGDPLGSQEWRPTGLRATPGRLLELRSGSLLETVRDWWFSPHDEQPVYRKGDRLRVEYILLDGREYTDLTTLTPDDLKDINWAADGVQATFLGNDHEVSSLDLLFSDFVLVEGEETVTQEAEPTA